MAGNTGKVLERKRILRESILKVAKKVNKNKNIFLTFEEKQKIIKSVKNGAKKEDIMRDYKISRSTLIRILKDQKNIEEKSKSYEWKVKKMNRSSDNEVLEAAMTTWLYQTRARGDPITGPILQRKALSLYSNLKQKAADGEIVLKKKKNQEFVASLGWLSRFKKRHGIRKKGEILSNYSDAAKKFHSDFTMKVKKEGLKLDNIYNADESGVQYRSLENTAFASHSKTAVLSKKEIKDRFTALFCANASGTHKLKLLAIGKSKKPKDIKNLNSLPVIYKSQQNAWMDQNIFSEWFKNDFIPSVLNHQQKTGQHGKVVLLMDDAPSHPSLEMLNSINANFEVVYLPPNTTATLQPLDQGLISLSKKHFRHLLLKKLYAEKNDDENVTPIVKEITLRTAFKLLSEVWDSIKQSTLRKAWKQVLGDLVQTAKIDNVESSLSQKSIHGACSIDVSEDDSAESSSERDEVIDDILENTQLSDRQEISEWLNKDDGDVGWGPLSDDGIVSVPTEDISENMQLSDRQKISERLNKDDGDVGCRPLSDDDIVSVPTEDILENMQLSDGQKISERLNKDDEDVGCRPLSNDNIASVPTEKHRGQISTDENKENDEDDNISRSFHDNESGSSQNTEKVSAVEAYDYLEKIITWVESEEDYSLSEVLVLKRLRDSAANKIIKVRGFSAVAIDGITKIQKKSKH